MLAAETMPQAQSTFVAFDLRVTLLYIEPSIWRSIRVPHDIRMDKLDGVLQTAFGWTDSHLHQFHVIDANGKTKAYVGRPDPNSVLEGLGRRPVTQDETKRLLKNFLTQSGDWMRYEYDFGDGWLHEINLIEIHPQSARLSIALCLDGARAGPPEDCGGPPGFAGVLAAVANPSGADQEFSEWLGDYDPTAFDLRNINRALARRRI
jgi:hypothetical protein